MSSRLPTAIGARKLQPIKALPPKVPLMERQFNVASKRHASPEPQRMVSTHVRQARLRRSKSMADLSRPGISLKRFAEPLNLPIPEKIQKLATQPINRAANLRPKLPKPSSLNSNSSTAVSSNPKTKSITNKTTTSFKTSSAASSSKTAVKRIPAYDYKARFADLLEKHKSLKEKLELIQEQLDQVENLPEKYADCVQELDETKELLNIAQKEIAELQTKNKENDTKIKAFVLNLNKLTEKHQSLTERHEHLVKEHQKMSDEMQDSSAKIQMLTQSNSTMAEELVILRELLFKSNIERKELHNAVMDLRGNIRVFCRVRPPLSNEENRALCGWQYLDETSLEITNNEIVASATGNRSKVTKYDFSFDQVFHQKSGQDDIFELVSPLIQSALDGYNVCIFAYGQTGSGKTYTMDGIQSEEGIIPRTVGLLFDCIQNYRQLGWDYKIKATFLEIYNEVLYDLLSNEVKDMDIRMANAKNPHEIYVSNITEITVESADSLRELMSIAKSNRATASTAGNERSSRSHAVTRLQLIGKHQKKNEMSIGTINLIDLAGSESPKTSIRMDETKKINKSLSELTNVIMALVQKQEHIPYRNSKLTYLLMPSLGGNSKTLMFVNVAPFQDCYNETIKSLRFASSVKSCKMTKVRKNKFMDTSSNSSSNASTISASM